MMSWVSNGESNRHRRGGSHAVAALLVILMCGLVPSGAGATIDRFHWFHPDHLGPPGGGGLTAIACSSGRLCTAVGDRGWEATFDPAALKHRKTKAVGHNQLLSVSCPSRSECAATSSAGGEVTFNPSTAKVMRQIVLDAGDPLTGVRCRGKKRCTAVDGVGKAFIFNPLNPMPSPTSVASEPLTAVSCPSKTRCTAVNDVGDEVTFNVSGPAHPQQMDIDGGRQITSLSCPSARQCTAVDASGWEVTFNPGTGSVMAGPTQVSFYSLNGVSCPMLGVCMVVDSIGREMLFNPGIVGGRFNTVRGASGLKAVFCPSEAECALVDNAGNVFVGLTQPVATSRPKIIGKDAKGQTLVEHHAPWAGVPKRFTYTWQRCGRSGSNCSIIQSAKGQRYRLTAADVGHRIRVLEIAYNRVSQSVPVNSFATRIVTG